MAVQNTAGTIEEAIKVIMTEVNALGADLTAIRTTLAAVQVDVASLYTALDSHVHGGITAGAANSAAVAAATAKSSAAPATLTKKGLKHDVSAAQN